MATVGTSVMLPWKPWRCNSRHGSHWCGQFSWDTDSREAESNCNISDAKRDKNNKMTLLPLRHCARMRRLYL